MGLKEEYEKRKQRREAVQYFRSNNSAFLSPKQYTIVIISILLISLLGGFIQAAITSGTGIRFGIVYLLDAYLIAMVAKKVSSYVNGKVRMICYIGYVIAILTTPIFMIGIQIGLPIIPALLLQPEAWLMAIQSILQPNILGWISYLIGAYELSMLLK